MTISRRTVLSGSLLAGASLLATRERAEAAPEAPKAPPPATPTGTTGRVSVPNGSVLASRRVDGRRVFHLVAEEFEHEVTPGLKITAWGYNRSTPGPVIEGTVGERIRVYVTNKLPEVTSVHWHGLFVRNGMDGVAGLTQKAIAPGKTFRYDITLDRAGTFMYHPHADEMTQIALGMMGMIVVHKPGAERRRVRDYCLMTHEMKIPIGTRRPDPLAMNDFNQLTFNGKSFPATEPLVAQTGDLVRLRLANLGPMDHHPIHVHGHAFTLVSTDGGDVPASARIPETTILVPVGTTRTVEFIADNPGDWPLHCHMTHHAMNQMGHDAPNLIGVDTKGLDATIGRAAPGYMTMGASGMSEMAHMAMEQPANSVSMLSGKGPYGVIEMGGMFTLIKVRDQLGAGDPGWYQAPGGTVASEATPDELRRDGITP
jgi:manganese oxidase